MSFDAHEAFSFDSFSQQLLWFDDFEGDSLKDLWDVSAFGAGTGVVVDAQTGGIIRLTTGGTSTNNTVLDWNDIRSLLVSKNAVIEYRSKLTQTANTLVRCFMRFDFTNSVYFQYDSSVDGNWHIVSSDGASTDTDTGVATDTDYHVFRIETSVTSVRYYIDDVLVGTHTTNIPDDATDYLQPQIFIQTGENAAKSMDVDYIYVRQER